jgi:hypothetical protein
MGIYTVDQLKALKPGQCIVVYRGDLDRDISTSSRSTPAYASILSELQGALLRLERWRHQARPHQGRHLRRSRT